MDFTVTPPISTVDRPLLRVDTSKKQQQAAHVVEPTPQAKLRLVEPPEPAMPTPRLAEELRVEIAGGKHLGAHAVDAQRAARLLGIG